MMRRGVILPAVLVTLAVGAMVGTTALFFADANRRGATAALEATQVRALGWSGVQAAMAELAQQREDLLAGEPPRLTGEWIAFTTPGGRAGLFRLAPLGEQGELAISENGKLDLNHAPEDAIAQLPGLTPELAAAIVAARPLDSLEDLLAIEGISAATLYGDAPEATAPGRERSAGQALASAEGASFAEGGRLALADTATVYSFDPNIQCGIEDADHRGERRLNLNAEFSERLGRALDRRFGEGTGQGVRQIMESGQRFETEADFIAVLRFFGVEPKDWPPVLDALTTSDDAYLPGRVDINAAPAEVLACLPGVDGRAAQAIVDARESMSPSSRRSVCWPVLDDLLTAEQLQAAAPWLTTRSTQWRVRVEAGLTAPGALDSTISADDLVIDEFGALAPDDGLRLQRRIVLEAVIDVASQRARVADLRDVTHAELARRLAQERQEARAGSAGRQDRDARAPEARDAPEAPDPRTDHMVGLDLGGPAPEDRAEPDRPEEAETAEPTEPAAQDPATGAEAEPAAIDRRRGRWTPGGAA